jgi:hypothetical protein
MNNVELVIDDKVVEVPDEITLGIYQQLMINGEIYENNPRMIISLFTKIPYPELKNLQVEQINLMEAFLSDRMVIPKDNELILTFIYKDVEYGLENDWSKLAWGAWTDFEVYSSDDIYANLHKIMAILYRPIISKDKKDFKNYKIVPYKSDEIDERAEIMKDVPVSYWLGAAQFFFSIAETYIKNMQVSLEQTNKMNEMILKVWMKLPKFLQKRLPLDSISILPTNSQKKTLRNLKKLKI